MARSDWSMDNMHQFENVTGSRISEIDWPHAAGIFKNWFFKIFWNIFLLEKLETIFFVDGSDTFAPRVYRVYIYAMYKVHILHDEPSL